MPKPGDAVIDADQDPDGVSAALGLDDAAEPDDEQDPDEVDEDDEDDEDDDPIEALRAELREQKRTIARLTREAAQARVKGKSSAGKAEQSDSETETVEQAAERGREEARLELGLERAGDRIRAALTGIIPEDDLDDFVDDLRLERYVDEDGKPDGDAIKALKDRQAKITRRAKRSANVGHARQGGGSGARSKDAIMGDTLASLGL